MSIIMKPVKSSNVEAIGYNSDKQEFHVKYLGGKTSVYRDVPADTAAAVHEAESTGKAVHAHLKGKFSHSYKED
jgi:hypothetical protein